MSTVRERFWLWGHEAGSHDRGWNLPAPSRMTPAEGASYMGIPNLIMVRYEGRPSPPFDQYARALRPLRQVVWSVVGAAGQSEAAEREHVLELAGRQDNFTGVMMDDFFRRPGEGEELGALPLGELHALRQGLSAAGLDLWVVLYNHQLDLPLEEHLRLCDVVSFWTWRAADLGALEENLARVEGLAPDAARVLGCYMWDYGDKKPMPVEAMRRQCEQGLAWLREGRIQGMIFLASCICDLGLETVEWTRAWIETTGRISQG